jgi:hypothetical protein
MIAVRCSDDCRSRSDYRRARNREIKKQGMYRMVRQQRSETKISILQPHMSCVTTQCTWARQDNVNFILTMLYATKNKSMDRENHMKNMKHENWNNNAL